MSNTPDRKFVGLILAGVAAAFLGLAGGWWLAQPDRSVPQFDRLAAEIGCQCPTCPRRPIATCGCGFADGMLAELHELVEHGGSDTEIMNVFAARYDDSVRIKPAGSGMGLTAWAAPMLLLLVGGVVVGGVIQRWSQSEVEPAADSPEAAGDDGDGPGDDGDGSATTTPDTERQRLLELVERELDGYED